MRVFISYCREDFGTAHRLWKDLTSRGLDCWFDGEDLLPGQRWRHEIERAIRRSDFFLALISSHSLTKRGFVQRELKLALDVLEEIPLHKVYVVPIRLDECELEHPALSDLQWVDLFPLYEEGFARLMRLFPFSKSAKKLLEAENVRAPARNSQAEAMDSKQVTEPLSSTSLDLSERFGALTTQIGTAFHPRDPYEQAQILARLLVSEIKLYNQSAVEEGWAEGNIYEKVTEYIERSWQFYKERVNPEVLNSTDYFYQELVEILAEGDESKLGFEGAPNRVGGGFSPPPPTPPSMRVRTGRFTADS
jgi:TIR domain-containing protein